MEKNEDRIWREKLIWMDQESINKQDLSGSGWSMHGYIYNIPTCPGFKGTTFGSSGFPTEGTLIFWVQQT